MATRATTMKKGSHVRKKAPKLTNVPKKKIRHPSCTMFHAAAEGVSGRRGAAGPPAPPTRPPAVPHLVERVRHVRVAVVAE